MKNSLQQQITRWYSHFGIDHVFVDLQSIKNSPSTQRFETLEELRNFVMNSDDICPLKKMSRNTVFSDGDPYSAKVMVIGEAPGETEDIEGLPFVGQSGMLLDKMLASIGISRKRNAYITNIVFWRPPGNRTPTAEEIAMCMPYVNEHIRLVRPKVILLAGGVAIKAILDTTDPVSRIRGRKHTYNGIDVVATFHPSYLLRTPGQKAAGYSDMLLLSQFL